MTKKAERNNARLEWNGRKLMCNGVCVALVGPMMLGKNWFHSSGQSLRSNAQFYGQRVSELSARRAVNRRFKLPADFGVTK